MFSVLNISPDKVLFLLFIKEFPLIVTEEDVELMLLEIYFSSKIQIETEVTSLLSMSKYYALTKCLTHLKVYLIAK